MPLQLGQQQGQQERWTAVMDQTTCSTCASLNNQVFQSGEGPSPPLHGGCRCNRYPIGGLPGGQPAGGGPGAQPIEPYQPPGAGGPFQPRRAIPQPTPTPTTVEQYGGASLVQPPLPAGGIPVFAGGRQVGAFPTGVSGEYVGFQQQPERIPEMQQVKKEAVDLASNMKQWNESLVETRKVQKSLFTRLKELISPTGALGPAGAPAGAGTPQHAVQAMLNQQFQQARQQQAWAGDPYAGAWESMRSLQPLGREGEGVVSPGRRPGLPGMIARQLQPLQEQLSAGGAMPVGRMLQRAASGYMLMRMGRMFFRPMQQAAEAYGGYELGLGGAAYGAGLGGGPAGIGADMLQSQAMRAQQQLMMGRASWQAWGGIMGMGGRGGEGMAALRAIGTPSLGIGAGALMLGASAPVAAGLGLGVGLAGAFSYATNIPEEQRATRAAQLQQQGVNVQGLAGAGQLGRWLQVGADPTAAGVQYGQDIMRGDLGQLSGAGRQAAMDYFVQNRMQGLGTMTPQQRQQLLGGYMGMTGTTDLQQVNQQLLTRAGQRAQMLGIQPGQAFQPFQQLAGQLGAGPGTGMAGALAGYGLGMGNERAMQQWLSQAGRVAPLARGAQEMFGLEYGAEAFAPGGAMAGLGGAGMGPERRRFQQMLGGNRLLWSEWGRETGRQDLITMEEGGQPVFTQELRGLQGEARDVQRGYRDWQQQQQFEQMQATQQYTRAQWGIQDQLRAQQQEQATWGFGYQQRAFDVAGAQWQERFDISGRQAMESMALGRQVFEARVGWQAQDVATQEQRAATQYEWQAADWAYGENVSQLQYGWKMEDISQDIRFATGREKKDLMEDQERMVILESMRREQSEEDKSRMEEERSWEEEDFETSKAQNEELIALQREQYDMELAHWEEDREMALRHHEEDRLLQVERMEKSREFYEEGKRLDDERIGLQREHQEQRMAWAMEAWEKAKEHNEMADLLADQTRELQEQQADVIANFQTMVTYSEELRESFEQWQQSQGYQWGSTASDWNVPADSMPSTPHAPGTGPLEYQHGGPVGSTESAQLHAGEYVVPAAGALVMRDQGGGLSEYEQKALERFDRLIQLAEKGGVVIVESMNPQKASEHVLSLEDAAWGMMPG